MNDADRQYLEILADLMVNGVHREGRNGATYGLFGAQMRFDLAQGFPLLTTKKVNFHAVVVELLWFLRGGTNVSFLHEHGVHIWDQWADANGDLGPVYGRQWRNWPTRNGKWSDSPNTIDQIANVVDGLRRDPNGRRHIVTAWNPAEIADMTLPPCHCLFQFHVAEGRLSCHLYQRSADWFIGVPFNIASYALLTHLIADELGLGLGDFIHSFGDLHLYENHLVQAREQLGRKARELPQIIITGTAERIFDIKPEDVHIVGYDPQPAIRAEVAA